MFKMGIFCEGGVDPVSRTKMFIKRERVYSGSVAYSFGKGGIQTDRQIFY